MSEFQEILQIDGACKSFGTVQALSAAALTVGAHEIHGLLGENGAGKSTLMRCLFGLTRMDEGRVQWCEQPIDSLTPDVALGLGIRFVPQHDMLVPALTALENFQLGTRRRGFFRQDADSRRLLMDRGSRLGVDVPPDVVASELSAGQRTWLSLIKCLDDGLRLLVLDETTALLSPPERRELFAALQTLKASGVSSVMITHKLEDVFHVCGRVTVLRGGKTVASRIRPSETSKSELAEMMVGAGSVDTTERATQHESGRVLLELRGLCDRSGDVALNDISLELRAGEVVGVAGVDGNGQHELMDALFGTKRPEAGSLRVDGEHVEWASPSVLRKKKIARIAEDRHAAGISTQMPIWQNVHFGYMRARGFVTAGIVRVAPAKAAARDLVQAYDVRSSSVNQLTGQLSGGNQQKVVIARELSGNPHLILAMNPSRGLDVAAAAFVSRMLIEARARGAGVLLVAYDLDELLGVADRVLVMSRGRVSARFTNVADARSAIGLAMTDETGHAMRDGRVLTDDVDDGRSR